MAETSSLPPSAVGRLKTWARYRALPALIGAMAPFALWGTSDVLRGRTWGLIGGPVLNWVVMMGMGSVWATALVIAAFVVDRVLPRGQLLTGWRQFGAMAVAGAIALPTLAALPLNEASVPMVAAYGGGAAVLVVGVVRFAVSTFLSPNTVRA